MNARRAIAVVAKREITARVRERSFLIGTSVTIGLLVLVAVLPALLGESGPTKVEVSAAGAQAEAVVRDAERAGPGLDLDIDLRRAADDAAARADVRAGRADAAVTGDPPRIVVDTELDDETGAVLQQAAAQVQRRAALADAGVTGAERDTLLAPRPLEVERLDPDAADEEELAGVATITVILLYGQLLMYGYWIASGVVEEKASRIVEVLLSAIRPRELLLGKLLGIGTLGLGQLLLVGVAGAIGVVTSGALDVPSGAWKALAAVLGFFLLGFAFYATLFAVAGALVQRQEDLQSSTTPLTTLAVLSFFGALAAGPEPDGTLAQVLTFVPPCTPMVLPVRLIAGDVPLWELAAAVLVLAGSAAILLTAAIRIYANAILRTGGRIRLAEAWRAS